MMSGSPAHYGRNPPLFKNKTGLGSEDRSGGDADRIYSHIDAGDQPMRECPVLIVGGGPVGLTASILLSRLGVPSLLVERHPSTSIHPKARGINIRTMEIFRQCGVEDAVRAAGLAQDRVRFIIWAESLAGKELERRTPARMRPDVARISFVGAALCAQDDLEPVLRRHAESLEPGTLRFNAELTALEQDADAVVAGFADGERVRVVSRRGQVEAPIRIDESLRPGLTFMTLHFQDDVATNLLTIDATDPKSGTAEFKATAIRIEKLATPVGV